MFYLLGASSKIRGTVLGIPLIGIVDILGSPYLLKLQFRPLRSPVKPGEILTQHGEATASSLQEGAFPRYGSHASCAVQAGGSIFRLLYISFKGLWNKTNLYRHDENKRHNEIFTKTILAVLGDLAVCYPPRFSLVAMQLSKRLHNKNPCEAWTCQEPKGPIKQHPKP